jgi:cytochrome c oxidase cbb3-type subunit III
MVLAWLLALLVAPPQDDSAVKVRNAAATPAQGRALYIANCSLCHGATGTGGRGPNLTTPNSVHGRDKDSIRRVVTQGIPGSQMPVFGEFAEEELASLVEFVQGLSAKTTAAEVAPGNAAAGKVAYAKLGCPSCHRINGEGSVFGPDLSRVGAGRSLAYLKESILNPGADIPDEYRAVIVTTAEGSRVSGIRINEDTFSVQLRDISQSFRSFKRDEVKGVEESKRSLMPPYQLQTAALDDLVAYLYTLRGDPAKSETKRQEGVR